MAAKELISVTARSAAVVSLCIALASLTVLAIVATIRDVDTLSVIALALAIMAFVVQIIVYVVQANSATQQIARSEEIYGATIKALAAIEEKSEGTRQAVTGINGRMIEALIGKSIPEAASAGVDIDSPEFSERLASRISEQMDRSSQPPESVNLSSGNSRIQGADLRFGRSDTDVTARREKFETFPDDDERIQRLAPVISKLSKSAIAEISWLIYDEIRYGPTKANQLSAGISNLDADAELYNAGIVDRVAVNWPTGDDSVFTLTGDGRFAGRILHGSPIPERWVEELRDSRAEFRAAHHRQEQMMSGRPIASSPVPVRDLTSD